MKASFLMSFLKKRIDIKQQFAYCVMDLLRANLGQSKVNQLVQKSQFLQGQPLIRAQKPKFVNISQMCDEENKLNDFTVADDLIRPVEMMDESFFILCLNIIDPSTSLIKVNEAQLKLKEFKKSFAINLSVLYKKSKLTRKKKKISCEDMITFLNSKSPTNSYMSFEFITCMATLMKYHIYVIYLESLELVDYNDEDENKLLFLVDKDSNFSLYNGKLDVLEKIKEYPKLKKPKVKKVVVAV